MVETLVRCSMAQHLIWVCTIYQYPVLGFLVLKRTHFSFEKGDNNVQDVPIHLKHLSLVENEIFELYHDKTFLMSCLFSADLLLFAVQRAWFYATQGCIGPRIQ